MNKNYISALTAALNETHLQPRDIRAVHMEIQGTLFFLCLRTDWQRYECYVDSESFQVLGLNFMPFTEEWNGSPEPIFGACVA